MAKGRYFWARVFGNECVNSTQSVVSGSAVANCGCAGLDLLCFQPIHCCWGRCWSLCSVFVSDCAGCQCIVMGCVILLPAGQDNGRGVLGHCLGNDADNIDSASVVVCAGDWQLDIRSSQRVRGKHIKMYCPLRAPQSRADLATRVRACPPHQSTPGFAIGSRLGRHRRLRPGRFRSEAC